MACIYSCYSLCPSILKVNTSTVAVQWTQCACAVSISGRCSALTCQKWCNIHKKVNNGSIKAFQCDIINGDLACRKTEQNVTPWGPSALGDIAPLGTYTIIHYMCLICLPCQPYIWFMLWQKEKKEKKNITFSFL